MTVEKIASLAPAPALACSLAFFLTGMPAAANAQSSPQNSVTLYGIVDAGISYLKTSSGARYSLLSGGLSGNRFGLKGQEDLGGGVNAIFQLENGFALGNGKLLQGGRAFGRQAFVGLASNTWGSVTFGRMYDPVVDLVQPITADGFGGSVPFATPGDVDNNDFSARVSNAIKYASPDYAGLRFESLFALGGVSGHTGQGITFGAAAAYHRGPLSVSGGYFQASNPNGDSGRRSTWSSSTTDALFEGGSINAGYITAHTLAIAQLAGLYAFGPFSVGAGYSNAQYRHDGESTFDTTEKFNTGRVFAFYRVSPALRFGAGYVLTAASGDTSARYNQGSVGAFYNLSKRTDVYTTAAYQRANGTQRTAGGALQSARATISSYGVDGTASQAIVTVGLRHRF